MYLEIKYTYWFFKHMYLKNLSCWKTEQTEQQFIVLSHLTVQTENEGHSIRKNHLNPLKTDNLGSLELILLKRLFPQHKEE